ncbi:hypothetical protein B0I26_101206 [Anoxybacillus vitaminiphilus]|uniref:Uncharacterized protein n=1 Tax=Paranoxybacillus vitaminiphilus TaxID=581036 RepID=A0A327YQM8_9BACL|nr:hypothetical protein [Anoxybacillus vitaminiphilus]RAK23250.1 hypothetical protein B0I26_101206 [Anoxybacillus vitaminiphilus]
MGKRKSSPWLATTSSPMLPLLIMTNEQICIPFTFEFFRKVSSCVKEWSPV